MENPFSKRLAELCEGKNFVKLCFLKIFWGFTSRKFQALLIVAFLCLCGLIETLWFVIFVGFYAGVNVAEKIWGR